MRHLSVLSDAFFVWHRGPFVTVNGCRLGRLPGQAVEWPEINAALGQTAMLASTVATRMGYVFHKYRIVPLGSYSHLALAGERRRRALKADNIS
jgi:beclin 1